MQILRESCIAAGLFKSPGRGSLAAKFFRATEAVADRIR